MKSGLVALAGRPNVGKSTLLNRLLGRKVAIMSATPQTTRSVIRGVLHRPEGQAVLLDMPGLHKPKTLLGQRLNDLARGTLAEVDLICLLVDATAGVGRGDRFLASEITKVKTPRFCLVNKVDAIPRARIPAALQDAAELAQWEEIVPISARTGEQLGVLVELIFRYLPEGPPLYPEDQVTDEPEQHFIAEVIREKAITLLRDELPHSVAVVVDELGPSADNPEILVVHATLYVERASQKPILLGRGGTLLRDIGTRARTELELLLGTRIYLDLHVKVAKEWQRDPKQLQRLGF